MYQEITKGSGLIVDASVAPASLATVPYGPGAIPLELKEDEDGNERYTYTLPGSRVISDDKMYFEHINFKGEQYAPGESTVLGPLSIPAILRGSKSQCPGRFPSLSLSFRRLRPFIQSDKRKIADSSPNLQLLLRQKVILLLFVRLTRNFPSLRHRGLIFLLPFRLLVRSDGQRYVTVNWFYRPSQTIHTAERTFLEQEVFKSSLFVDHKLEDIIERISVLYIDQYTKGRFDYWNEDMPLYVVEHRWNIETASFSRIKKW